MRGDEDPPAAAGDPDEDGEHGVRSGFVLMSGGFVGDDEVRPADDGSCNGHPLLFAQGELVWAPIAEVAHLELVEHRRRRLAGAATEPECERDVLSRVNSGRSPRSCGIVETDDQFVVRSRCRRMLPRSGVSQPTRRCSRVDLPEPDGPTRPTLSPLAMLKETSSSARTVSARDSKRRVTPMTSMSGSVMVAPVRHGRNRRPTRSGPDDPRNVRAVPAGAGGAPIGR